MPRIKDWDEYETNDREGRKPRKMKIREPDGKKRGKVRRGRKTDKGFWNLEE